MYGAPLTISTQYRRVGTRTPATYPQSFCESRLYLIDPRLIQRTYMAQTQCSLLPNRSKSLSLRVPMGSQQARKGTLDQKKQHIFDSNQTQLELSRPEPRSPYSRLILSVATQQIPGTRDRHTLLALFIPTPQLFRKTSNPKMSKLSTTPHRHSPLNKSRHQTEPTTPSLWIQTGTSQILHSPTHTTRIHCFSPNWGF